MTKRIRFAATAFLREPILGRREITTTVRDPDLLLATSPVAAARIWYWRLTDIERAVCTKVVVGAWTLPTYESLPSYGGPQIAYDPKAGWLEIDENRSEVSQASRTN